MSKRHPFTPFIMSLLMLMTVVCSYAQSPLADGMWAKFEISETGVYRLSYEALSTAGIVPEGPYNLLIMGLPGGPLPQANDATYPDHVVPIPYKAFTASADTFAPGDYIVFFAEGAHTLRWKSDGFSYTHNPYDNENYIFITTTSTAVEPVSTRMPLPSGGAQVDTYTALDYHESTLYNLLQSGREWYGERFESITQRSFSFEFPLATANGNVAVRSNVMSQSFGTASFDVSINGINVGEQSLNPVPDFLNPPSNNPFTYSVKGRERTDEFTAQSDGSSLTVSLNYNKSAGARSVGYLDYLVVGKESRIELHQSQTQFSSRVLCSAGDYTIRVGSVEEPSHVWDITDMLNPEEVGDLTFSENSFLFKVTGKENARYVVFNPPSVPEPDHIDTKSHTDLFAGTPDLLIVAHRNFISAANRLASFRRSADGMDVMVVSTDEVFDQVSSGREDPTAIRNLARHLYTGGNLKYLLLFGKGSYDYYGVLPFFSNYVPIYQSRNSLEPLDTYASDDYFGFMEPDEGEWPEIAGGNHTMDIGVGRLPVTTTAEANNVVDKIIRYNSDEEALGSWRSRLLFVADDEDFNLHHRQSDQLAIKVDTSEVNFQVKRIFLGSFQQVSGGGGETSPKASEVLNTEIRKGALIVNYTGHGNEVSWTQERILTNSMIPEWRNTSRLPLFITATCEFGRHDDPTRISGGEQLITEPGGGGIGILTTGRPVFANSNFKLNEAFYNSVFEKTSSRYQRLGEIMRLTKNRSVDLATDIKKVGNRNFSLLGDPSMSLSFPVDPIEITSIEVNGEPADTIRSGDRVTIRGEIMSSLPYNGKVFITIRDKPSPLETRDNPKYMYDERINSVFQGSATVREGLFSADFIVPVNISNKKGYGRLYLYAQNENGLNDGMGSKTDLILSSIGSEQNSDTEGPAIAVYFGDSTNTQRTEIPSSTLLLVNLRDQSGINTSGFGVGNNLTAILDDSASYILNDYYRALPDSFKEGWAIFPLNDLSPGIHDVTITARDVFNNSSQISVSFEVADPGTLIVNSLRNFPNPVKKNTTIRLTHNRPGDNLDIHLTIMDTRGSVIAEQWYYEENTTTSITLPIIENLPQMENLSGGIYIYGVEVRSRLDGASDQRYEKMMVLREK